MEAVQLYEKALNHAEIGIAIVESIQSPAGRIVDLRVLFVNDAYLQFTPYARIQLYNLPLSEVLLPEQDFLFRQLLRSAETGTAIHLTRSLFGHWLDIRAEREDQHLVITLRDITDQIRSAEQYHSRSDLLRKVFHTVQSGLMVCKAIRDETGEIVDFQVTYSNRANSEVTQFSHEEILAKTMLTLDPAGRHNGIFDAFRHVVQTGEPFRQTHHFEQRHRWLDVAVSKYDDGVVAFLTDVTELKETSLRYQRLSAQLQTILDASQAAIVLLEPIRNDAGQIITFRFSNANATVASILGKPLEQLIGQRTDQLLPSAEKLGIRKRYVRVMETGQPDRFTYHYVADGINGWFDTSVRRVGDQLVVTAIALPWPPDATT